MNVSLFHQLRKSRVTKLLGAAVLSLSALCNLACVRLDFLVQAAEGQWRLGSQARPIAEVLADTATEARTRALLNEVVRAKNFGALRGLKMHENYESFIQLQQPYVVWFVNASEPLSLKPISYTFPLVGSFPGLSWFDEGQANEFAASLRATGLDVNVRGVSAFSTGGWFDDPVLSSMFVDHAAQTGILANLILHESLHATVLVPNQQYFNESLASFVADTLTPSYLAEYWGPSSREFWEHQRAVADSDVRTNVLQTAFDNLQRVYESPLSDAAKLLYKSQVMTWIAERIRSDEPPNNATLIGLQLYREGKPEFARLLAACDRDWPRFLHAFSGLTGNHFSALQTPDIGPVIDRIREHGCRPLPDVVLERSYTPQLRRHGLPATH